MPKSLTAAKWMSVGFAGSILLLSVILKLQNVIITRINVSAYVAAGHTKVQIAENLSFHEAIIRVNIKLSFISHYLNEHFKKS